MSKIKPILRRSASANKEIFFFFFTTLIFTIIWFFGKSVIDFNMHHRGLQAWAKKSSKLNYYFISCLKVSQKVNSVFLIDLYMTEKFTKTPYSRLYEKYQIQLRNAVYFHLKTLMTVIDYDWTKWGSFIWVYMVVD